MKEKKVAAPIFRLTLTRTTLGPAHHVQFEIPGGVCTPAEFAEASKTALRDFVPSPGHGIVLDGRGPVWGYSMLVHDFHPTSWLAVRDPRLGLVVVATHTAGVEAGDIVDFRTVDAANVVVAVCGPPHSGKSVFLAELYRQILAIQPSQFCFLQRAAPDGEGMWSAESTPEVVKELRKKGSFSQEFNAYTENSIDSLAKVFPLLLLDMPGRRDEIAATILKHSSHVIVLSSSSDEADAWRTFALNQGCALLADLRSRQLLSQEKVEGSCSQITLTGAPVVGALAGLERVGPREPYESAVASLAVWLVDFVKRRQTAMQAV